MLNFAFVFKESGNSFSLQLVYDFLLLEILGNMFIALVWFPGCDIINFEINLIFLIKLFFYMSKNSRQKFKYLKNDKSS